MQDLFSEFDRIVRRLEEEQIRYAVIGALALALHGHIRATGDMDFLLHPGDLEQTLGVMKSLDYIQSNEPRTFKNIELTLWRFLKPIPETEEFYMVDMLLTEQEKHIEMLGRAEMANWGKIGVKVVRKEDLIHLKKSRGSKQDLADIEFLKG